METDYVLFILQFVHNCYVAAFVWAIKIGPISLLLFWPIMIAIYYVLTNLFVYWPQDYRCWRNGGIGKASFSTRDYSGQDKTQGEGQWTKY